MQDDTTLVGRFRALLRGRGAAPADEPVAIPQDDPAPPALSATGAPRFLIVTPVFNAGPFIDEAIASVLRQSVPGFVLHYHVQDGGSTDGTVDKLRAWQRRSRDDFYVPHADRIVFTFASERDGGMYDALQRGFACLDPRDEDILTWINSDDCLAQGSLVTVGGVFRDVPDCEFLSGRIALLSEAGAVVVLGNATPYARNALAAGLHDGRTLPFVMQEGTFYSGRVWNTVGGVDPSFRLAGDWDLWRRMARVAKHCVVDSVTGYHRRRAGQLSGDMDAYHREIDTASVLPDATELGPFGTFIMYDVAGARWVETAYDPAMVAAPTLLRDGRSELSAVCRPVTGFAAPEGPYAQYQLPGGIRWIKGNRAEVALFAPAGGRYRLRLTVRPSRPNLVIGLAIGARTPQPIMLEAPIPLTDQVIETVRWLDMGANRLLIDCEGAPDERLLLLIRCEATSIDDAFLRRPVLPPVRPQGARRAPAIAILCEDDEPDLLDASLTNCAAVMPGAAVFVVRDPGNAALDRVIQRHDAVAGCIDSIGAAETTALRQRLHAAGHDDVLVIRRGLLVTPRGIEAASTLLDATGAGAAGGLVNERESMGRSLQLSVTRGEAPVLYRATGAADTTLQVGCALAQGVVRAGAVRDASVIWVLDGDRPMLGRTPAALLAAGLALLGHDVRHVVVGTDPLPMLPPDALTVASQELARGLLPTQTAAMTIGRDGDRLRLVPNNGVAIDLPLAIDTDLLLPRDRHEARVRLGFAPDERIVCIAEASPEATAATIAWVNAMPEGRARILNFGQPSLSPASSDEAVALDSIADPLLLSYLLSAADVAVTAELGGGMLASAAWSCGVTVLDLDGKIRGPGGDPADAPRARDLMVATRSLISLAMAIDAHCLALGGGSSPLYLRSGHVQVRSYGRAHPGGFDTIASFCTVTMLDDELLFVAPDGERGRSIGGRGGDMIVSLGQAGVQTLRLHLRGTPGDTWTVHAGGGTATVRIGAGGDDMASVTGHYDIGPTHVRFERHGGDAAAPLLHVVGLSQTGLAMAIPTDWEETMFELVSADARPAPTLEIDGDWQRVAGFLAEQAPVPPVGMYVPFHWNLGDTCRIRLRITTGGPRTLHLALAAGMRDQRVRLVVGGRAYDWCTPLVGPIGHVERRAWLVDWPTGDIDVTLEISDVLRTMPQEVGLMLFGATLGHP